VADPGAFRIRQHSSPVLLVRGTADAQGDVLDWRLHPQQPHPGQRRRQPVQEVVQGVAFSSNACNSTSDE
jgi:hypothetical protein